MKKLYFIWFLCLSVSACYAQYAPVSRSHPGGVRMATSFPDPPTVYDTVFITIKDRVRNKQAKAINEQYKSAPVDTTNRLAKMTDDKRTQMIKQALEEEERFKNYRETTETTKTKGEEMTVKKIYVGDDYYEMLIDKKGGTRCFKNSKPITRITFDFETTRRMVDVLNTIRQVEKFGK